MYGRAYLIRPLHDTPESVARAYRVFKEKVRQRFSRESSPIYHLGGNSFDERLNTKNHPDCDLESHPKNTSTFEDTDIFIGDGFPEKRAVTRRL